MISIFTKLQIVRDYVKANMPNLPYHNFLHVEQVVAAVEYFANELHVEEKNKFLLLCAAYTHDLVVVPGANDNEEKSCLLAEKILIQIGCSKSDIYFIFKLIMATKVGVKPKTLFEQILKDADLFNLGTNDYLKSNHLVRSELPPMSDEAWHAVSLKFLAMQTYYTIPAQKLLTPGLEHNIMLMKKQTVRKI